MDSFSLRWAEFMVWRGPGFVLWGRRFLVLVIIIFSSWAVVDSGRALYHASILSVRVLPVSTQSLQKGYAWSHTGFDPQSLQISTVAVLPNALAGVNALAEITNPNPSWLAHARVHFVSDRGQSPVEEVAVLPGKQQPFLDVGLPDGGI